MRNNKGFTLIEMVVVLAVVAILAAILTPTIAKNIQDAKLTRATNEAQVIGAAMASFFKDVGRWPTADGTDAALGDALTLIHGGVGDDPAGGIADWDKDTAAATTDIFEYHLVDNNPGNAANDYTPWSDATKMGWNGPYIGEIKPDPWGVYYACNVVNAYDSPNNLGAWVLSFGVNRNAETTWATPRTTIAPEGDDVGVRID